MKRSTMTTHVYVCSAIGEKTDGILLYALDPDKGGLTLESKCQDGVSYPFYAVTDPKQKFLFATDLVETCDGRPGGAVCTYAIDPATGALTFLNRKSSEGTTPCYVSVTANGRFVLVANYGDGVVAVFRVEADGRLGETVAMERPVFPSGDTKREAHAHSIVLDAANRFALVAELGLDQVITHRFDDKTGKLTRVGKWSAPRGAGPRHFVFHPDGRHAYVINELNNTVVAFAYDAGSGKLEELQTLPALPKGFQGENYTADLRVHPNGRFLYGSNRGHESVVMFTIDPKTGRLKLVGHEPTQGKFPNGLGMDPSGTCLLAGNQKSDRIVSFRIDQKSGVLTPTGSTMQMRSPACFTFLQRKSS